MNPRRNRVTGKNQWTTRLSDLLGRSNGAFTASAQRWYKSAVLKSPGSASPGLSDGPIVPDHYPWGRQTLPKTSGLITVGPSVGVPSIDERNGMPCPKFYPQHWVDLNGYKWRIREMSTAHLHNCLHKMRQWTNELQWLTPFPIVPEDSEYEMYLQFMYYSTRDLEACDMWPPYRAMELEVQRRERRSEVQAALLAKRAKVCYGSLH